MRLKIITQYRYLRIKKFCKEYLALQNPKKYLICAWKLLVNEGNYALKIDGDRQTDRQTERQKDRKTERQKDRKTERQTDRQTKSLIELSFAPKKKML